MASKIAAPDSWWRPALACLVLAASLCGCTSTETADPPLSRFPDDLRGTSFRLPGQASSFSGVSEEARAIEGSLGIR